MNKPLLHESSYLHFHEEAMQVCYSEELEGSSDYLICVPESHQAWYMLFSL